MSNASRTFEQVLREVLDRDFGGSNADFARAAGINIAQVGRYLSGQKPRPETIRKMAPHMGMSYHKLMDLADAQVDDDTSGLAAAAHVYAIQLNQLIGEGSTMPEDERKGLEQVVNTVLTPYRKYLGGRKAV